jgi:hypothetical protein
MKEIQQSWVVGTQIFTLLFSASFLGWEYFMLEKEVKS